MFAVDVQFGEAHPLQRLLTAVDRRLPVELSDEILRSLGDTFFSCLLTAAQTATLAASPPPSGKLPRLQALEHDGPITSIHGKVSHLFGRECLVYIGFNRDEGRRLVIDVENTEIAGVQFALDIDGLCAIRVKYSSKCVSPWLGNPSTAWYGEIPGNGTDLRSLRLLRDVRTYRATG